TQVSLVFSIARSCLANTTVSGREPQRPIVLESGRECLENSSPQTKKWPSGPPAEHPGHNEQRPAPDRFAVLWRRPPDQPAGPTAHCGCTVTLSTVGVARSIRIGSLVCATAMLPALSRTVSLRYTFGGILLVDTCQVYTPVLGNWASPMNSHGPVGRADHS